MLLNQFLVLAAVLFCIGVYGVIARKNGVLVLMSVELILNAVNINLVAFSAMTGAVSGQVFALFVIAVAAAEVGVGQSMIDEGPVDEDDTAYQVFGGYQFNRWFGLEAGYADLGELEPDAAGRSLEASSVYFTAVGTLPFTGKFSGYAKAGFQRWDLDTSIPGLAGTGDDSGTDPTYGLGLQYRFTDAFALRGEYSRFEIEDVDVDLAQLQARFDF